MNWNQEELEQWALATRQKEEDHLTLEKYRRADETKIKELTLQIEKLTISVSKKQQELEKEVTETQAAQIELDKTAQEFKRLHIERHQLYLQWAKAVQDSTQRDKYLADYGKMFQEAKQNLKEKEQDHKDNQKILERAKDDNARKETEN